MKKKNKKTESQDLELSVLGSLYKALIVFFFHIFFVVQFVVVLLLFSLLLSTKNIWTKKKKNEVQAQNHSTERDCSWRKKIRDTHTCNCTQILHRKNNKIIKKIKFN